MGSAPSKNDKFEFHKKHYIEIIQEAMKKNTINSNDDALKIYGCLIPGHLENPIEFICSNVICNAQFRMVCKICTQQELHIGDKEKLLPSLRLDHEISDIIQQFKILINKVIDSLEFDIMIEQLECQNQQNQQKIMPQIHNLKQLKQDLLKYKEKINKLDNKNYYEMLRNNTNKTLGLLEYFQQHSIHLQKLEVILKQKNYQSQQNVLDLQQIDQEGKNSKQQQVLLDLFRNQHYQHKYKDKKIKKIIDEQVNQILKSVNQQVKNKYYDEYYLMYIFQYHQRRDQVFLNCNLTESEYKVILGIQVQIYINMNKNNMAFELLSSITQLLPLKMSFLDQSFRGNWNIEEANKIIDYIICSVSEIRNIYLTYYPNLQNRCVSIEDLKKLIPYFQFCLIKGYFQQNQNKIDETLMAFDTVIKLNPMDQERYYTKAQLLRELNKTDEAIIVVDQVIQLNPKEKKSYQLKAVFLGILKKFDKAILVLDQLIEQDPNDGFNYRKKAIFLGELNKFDEAVLVLDQQFEQDPNYRRKAIFLGKLMKFDEEILVLDQLIEQDPNDGFNYRKKAIFLGELNKFDEAILAIDLAIKLEPQNTYVYWDKAGILKEQRKFDEALLAIDLAIKLEPENIFLYWDKAAILKEQRKFDEALLAIDLAIKLKPENTYLYWDKARILEEQRKLDEAILAIDLAIKLEPENIYLYWDKAQFLGELNKFDEAILVLYFAIKLDPEHYIIPQIKEYKFNLIQKQLT